MSEQFSRGNLSGMLRRIAGLVLLAATIATAAVAQEPPAPTPIAVFSQTVPLDPRDPVKYDFALCHLGVSRECPSRRDAAKCARCVVRDVCRHW